MLPDISSISHARYKIHTVLNDMIIVTFIIIIIVMGLGRGELIEHSSANGSVRLMNTACLATLTHTYLFHFMFLTSSSVVIVFRGNWRNGRGIQNGQMNHL